MGNQGKMAGNSKICIGIHSKLICCFLFENSIVSNLQKSKLTVKLVSLNWLVTLFKEKASNI